MGNNINWNPSSITLEDAKHAFQNIGNGIKEIATKGVGKIQSGISGVREAWPDFKTDALTKLSSIKNSMVEKFGSVKRSAVKRFNPDAGARMSMNHYAESIRGSLATDDYNKNLVVGKEISNFCKDSSLTTEQKARILKSVARDVKTVLSENATIDVSKLKGWIDVQKNEIMSTTSQVADQQLDNKKAPPPLPPRNGKPNDKLQGSGTSVGLEGSKQAAGTQPQSIIKSSEFTKEQYEFINGLPENERKDWEDYYRTANIISGKLDELGVEKEGKETIMDLVDKFGWSENYSLDKLQSFFKVLSGEHFLEEIKKEAEKSFGIQGNSTLPPPLNPPQQPSADGSANKSVGSNEGLKQAPGGSFREKIMQKFKKVFNKVDIEQVNEKLDYTNTTKILKPAGNLDDEAFKEINKNTSLSGKVAMLQYNSVSLAQKQTILKSNSGEILAYAKKHKILDQVAYGSIGGWEGTFMPKTVALTTAVFDEKGRFNISYCEEGLKTFFNPTMFTTEERATIVKQLEGKKIQNPQTDADKFNNLQIDTTILMFNNDNIEKKCEEFNKIFNNIMSEIKDFAEGLPEVMDDNTKNKINVMKNYCEGIAKIINLFHLKAPEGPALNALWNANAAQGATRISMPLDAILKQKIGDDISGAKQETLKRAQNQPIIQKAKYEVCKHYDGLSEDEKKHFLENNKNYAFDTTGLELTNFCHKETGKIDTSPKEEINVFSLNDTAMHQVATTLGLLDEHEKFNIGNYFIKYGQKPILINGKEVTAQQIMDIVKNGKDNETKLTITQVKRDSNGNPIVSGGKQVTEQVEKTLAELI